MGHLSSHWYNYIFSLMLSSHWCNVYLLNDAMLSSHWCNVYLLAGTMMSSHYCNAAELIIITSSLFIIIQKLCFFNI
jgi:hypothetical protein